MCILSEFPKVPLYVTQNSKSNYMVLRVWWFIISWQTKMYTNKTKTKLFLPISSVQSLGRLGRQGDTRDNSAEIPFQSFLQEVLVISSGMGRDVQSLMLSIQHFLCWPQQCPPSEMPQRMVWERLLWLVICPSQWHIKMKPSRTTSHTHDHKGICNVTFKISRHTTLWWYYMHLG